VTRVARRAHFARIPVGITSAITGYVGSFRTSSLKHVLLAAQALLLISTVLLAFADSPDKYWTFVFPAFVVGSTGAMMTFTQAKSVICRLLVS
jgi:nitrate/nitrite transporter NarK